MTLRAFMAGVLLLLASCGSLVPMKRTESIAATETIANQQQLMIESVVRSRPFSTNAIVEDRLKVAHNASQSAGADEEASFAVSMPIAVSMILGALALVLLAVALFAIRRSSAVGHAADEGVAALIRSARSIVSGLSDDKAKTSLTEIIAQAEAARGKLAKQ